MKIQADALSERSRAAIGGIGATSEGIVRGDLPEADGSWRDSAVFSTIVADWPRVVAVLEAKLERYGDRAVLFRIRPAWRDTVSSPHHGYPQNMSDTVDPAAQLLSLRQSIDNVDAALVHLLAERFKFTQQVGRLKASSGLPAADPGRELEQITKLKALASESHLDPAFGEKFLGFIIAEVIHQHEQIASTGAIETHPA